MCICQSCLCYLRNSHQICPAATPFTHTKLKAATWYHSPAFPHGKSAGTEQCHQSHGHEIPWRDPPGGRTSRTGPHSLRSAKQCQLLYCLDQNMHLLSQKKGPLYKICLCLLVLSLQYNLQCDRNSSVCQSNDNGYHMTCSLMDTKHSWNVISLVVQ